ncbi:MAG: hypothetical protein H7Y11_00645 [Armatimonadetes bacterium]|nr:hypothetical protein [Anaerolineae bacterium]
MMDYSMIGKIQKAKEYAEDPSRVTFNSFTLEFDGSNDSYIATLGADGWHCTCPGFQMYAICPHIMSMERRFGPMLKRQPLPYAAGQNLVSDVDKAKHYADDLETRVRFIAFNAQFRGGHNAYTINYDNGVWECDNPYFISRGICSNTMAMERILKGMVRPLELSVPVD